MEDLEPLKEQDVPYDRYCVIRVDFFNYHGFSPDQFESQGCIGHFHLQYTAVDGDALGLSGAQFADVFRPLVQNRALSVKLLLARLVHELQGQFPD